MAGHDASWPLQLAVIAALKAHSGVTAIVSDRVYDTPPKGAQKPYTSLGPSQVSPELADEYAGARNRFQVDGWTANAFAGVRKTLGQAITDALHDAQLTLSENQRCVFVEHEQTHHLTEPDGTTRHVAVIFTAATEPTE